MPRLMHLLRQVITIMQKWSTLLTVNRGFASTHHWLHAMFTEKKLHIIRRFDKFWAGLSTDLVIEQTMMRAIKGRGGVTHGHGIDENVRLTWVHSMHQCASVHMALNLLTAIKVVNQQHIDLGSARATGDWNDTMKLVS